jgi:hypothetical protein
MPAVAYLGRSTEPSLSKGDLQSWFLLCRSNFEPFRPPPLHVQPNKVIDINMPYVRSSRPLSYSLFRTCLKFHRLYTLHKTPSRD